MDGRKILMNFNITMFLYYYYIAYIRTRCGGKNSKMAGKPKPSAYCVDLTYAIHRYDISSSILVFTSILIHILIHK